MHTGKGQSAHGDRGQSANEEGPSVPKDRSECTQIEVSIHTSDR